MSHRVYLASFIWLACLCLAAAPLRADPSETEKPADETKAAAADGASSTPATNNGRPAAMPKQPPFSEVLGEAEAIDGLIKLYRKDTRVYAELAAGDLNKDFIVVISIARGIGRRPLLGGMSWGSGDDWIWQFRKTDDRIQIVRRNVRFRAAKGSPEERAVRLAYTDSVLFSLPIATTSAAGGSIVDLTPVFMSDLPQIGAMLRGFSFSADKSTWASVKGFRDNIELQVAATYASGGTEELDTVPDSRGATINVHYSLSRLPDTGYEPRLADDRVGYFLTVVKDYSKGDDPDRFVRYINRWDLRKAEASAAVSPPKKPVVFWLEKTIPYPYRAPIREGIQEWNKAFEKAGLVNAIEVRQQPDDAEWDPEDINYNTFRWMTASAGFAMGPSRVNPVTGQILDADIIFDADFVAAWKGRVEMLGDVTQRVADRTVDPRLWGEQLAEDGSEGSHHRHTCECATGCALQLALGSVLAAPDAKPMPKEQLEKLIAQGIRSVAVHEVGHTLGLRHNFRASTLLTIDELSDPNKTRSVGLASSVMDYLPMNISPKGAKQGEYFMTVIGPYDHWAIEYGYKPLDGDTDAEHAALKKIASRSGEPALQYATDEDTRSNDPDPLTNRYDLGKDPLAFIRRQMQVIEQAWPNLPARMTADGDGYQRARRAFNLLLAEYGRQMHFASRFVGGVYVSRSHKGDPKAPPPMVVVEAARQREAMDLLAEHVFHPESLQFPPELINQLAPSFWRHWGAESLQRNDYALHDMVMAQQDRILDQLMTPLTIARLLDNELKVAADNDVFPAAEMFSRLSTAIFAELGKLGEGEFTDRKPGINSLRRTLQRRYVDRLADLALGRTGAPVQGENLATANLTQIQQQLESALDAKALDASTRLHLEETKAHIRRILDARINR
jgi:hypothetical protein